MYFELLLQKHPRPSSTKGVVSWEGQDGPDAAKRYAETHPGETVIAWRPERHGVFIGPRRILDGRD